MWFISVPPLPSFLPSQETRLVFKGKSGRDFLQSLGKRRSRKTVQLGPGCLPRFLLPFPSLNSHLFISRYFIESFSDDKFHTTLPQGVTRFHSSSLPHRVGRTSWLDLGVGGQAQTRHVSSPSCPRREKPLYASLADKSMHATRKWRIRLLDWWFEEEKEECCRGIW